MSLTIEPVKDSDWDVIASFTVDAFAGMPIWQVDFPYPNDTEGKKKVVERFRKEIKETEETKVIKATDSATGTIISVAIWTFFGEDPYSRDPEGEGANEPYTAEWFGDDASGAAHSIWVNTALRDWKKSFPLVRRPHCHLKLCVTDPQQGRKGGASALINWGVKRADARCLPCFLHASERAYQHKVYQKHGFHHAMDVVLHDEERFPGKPAVKLIEMYRPAPGESMPERWPVSTNTSEHKP